MTVFKGFLTITKRNLGMMFLYIAVFLTISIFVSKTLGDSDPSGFTAKRLNIAVIDRDKSLLSKGLKNYLRQFHHVKDVPDDAAVLQDKLFYRDIYYAVIIPENFEQNYTKNTEKLPVIKVPGSTSGHYVDQQINTFLNNIRTLTAGGFSASEALEYTEESLSFRPNVRLIDQTGHNGNMAKHAYMFQYMPYIILSILCYILSYIMLSFGNKDVKNRILCSCTSTRSMNLQLILGHIVIGLGIFLICVSMPAILYPKDFLTDPNLPYYLINSFLMMLVALSIAFLISSFPLREETINGIVNVVSLGMSFICGVFVSMDILGKGVKTLARFLPVYWYEIVNNLLARNHSLSASQTNELWQCYGIQLLFALSFLAVAMVIRRKRPS